MASSFRGKVSASGWQLALASLDEAAAWEPWLSSEEEARAVAMTNPILRARFVVSRGLRRRFLAETLGCEPADLAFAEESGTKPRLRDECGWDFNVSHAGDYVVLLVGRGDVGVDLERIRPVRDMAAVARRYFHPDEAAAWRTLASPEQEAAFFLLWSAREAAMKCAGTGLAGGLERTRVDPGLLRSKQAGGVVGAKEMILQREQAPQGYVLVTARAVS